MVASDIEVAQTIGFGIIALVMVLCGVGVVASRNVVHAALSLVAVMAGRRRSTCCWPRSSWPSPRCSSTSEP